jgi:hypothetical protein
VLKTFFRRRQIESMNGWNRINKKYKTTLHWILILLAAFDLCILFIVVGKALLADQMGGGILRRVVYHCMTPLTPPFMKRLDPILLENPFPKMDPTNSIPLNSGLQSTIFWTYAVSANGKDDVTVSFYTNDLTGPFECFLKGVSVRGIIEQRSQFIVNTSEN